MDKDVDGFVKEILVIVLQILVTTVCFVGYGYACTEAFRNAYPVASRLIQNITVFSMTLYICNVRIHNRNKSE